MEQLAWHTHKQITDGPKCDKNVLMFYKEIQREYLYEFEIGERFFILFCFFKRHYSENHKGNNRKTLQHQRFKLSMKRNYNQK